MIIDLFKNINITGSCSDSVANFLIFDLNIAPNLLYYAYIPIIIISIFLGFYVLLKDRYSLINKLFFLITSSFALWSINVLFQWIAVPNYTIYLSWKLMPIFEMPIYLGSIYFIYVYCYKKDLDILFKKILFYIYLIFIVLSFTNLNISGYDYVSCEGIPGILLYFLFGLELLSIVLISIIGHNYIKKENILSSTKKSVTILTSGLVIFLSIFWYSEVFGVATSDYEINLIGPFGMLIFVILITYSIVKFKTFNIKILSTQSLIWGFIVLIGSQFFFIKSITNFILNTVTFLGIIVLGRFLIKSVKVEILQRERLENLRLRLEESNQKLENNNEKLKDLDKLKTEFVSLASHQLRGPLTAINGYASMLSDGDFGKVDNEAKEAIDRIYQSSKNLTIIVEDLLNVTKIEAGGMKYEITKFNLYQIASDEVKDFSVIAEKKGLKISFEGENEGRCVINADKEKIRQIIINLIDNSIKYTKEGCICVSVRNNKGKVIFSVKDTGMGMTQEIKESLFQKFARGDGARMNTTGSGLGLYLAKQIIEAHKGRIWVESEGTNKGSIFYVELDEAK